VPRPPCSTSDNPAASDVISSTGDYVRFALRVRVEAYPEDMVAVWVMLAVRFQPVGRGKKPN
jgi:hypothetical protein